MLDVALDDGIRQLTILYVLHRERGLAHLRELLRASWHDGSVGHHPGVGRLGRRHTPVQDELRLAVRLDADPKARAVALHGNLDLGRDVLADCDAVVLLEERLPRPTRQDPLLQVVLVVRGGGRLGNRLLHRGRSRRLHGHGLWILILVWDERGALDCRPDGEPERTSRRPPRGEC